MLASLVIDNFELSDMLALYRHDHGNKNSLFFLFNAQPSSVDHW